MRGISTIGYNSEVPDSPNVQMTGHLLRLLSITGRNRNKQATAEAIVFLHRDSK